MTRRYRRCNKKADYNEEIRTNPSEAGRSHAADSVARLKGHSTRPRGLHAAVLYGSRAPTRAPVAPAPHRTGPGSASPTPDWRLRRPPRPSGARLRHVPLPRQRGWYRRQWAVANRARPPCSTGRLQQCVVPARSTARVEVPHKYMLLLTAEGVKGGVSPTTHPPERCPAAHPPPPHNYLPGQPACRPQRPSGGSRRRCRCRRRLIVTH